MHERENGGEGVEFRLLGPVEVRCDGELQQVGGTGVRAVLAHLLVEANQVVPLERLIDTVWEDDPPATARTIIHGYVSRLRRLLDALSLPATKTAPRLETRHPGYVLRVDESAVDLHRVRGVVNTARTLDPSRRARELRTALEWWRGEPLADVPAPGFRRAFAENLRELWLYALEERIEAELELGNDAEALTELSALAAEHPFRERVVGQLMLALYRCGRRAEAQARYHELREKMVEELGLDPGPELRELHERVLRDDDSLRSPGAVSPRGDGDASAPAELPAPVRGFVGRADEIGVLDDLIGGGDVEASGDGVGVVAGITGSPGVGKSALASTWAHHAAERFPDGQLYAELRGFDPLHPPPSPGEVLGRFLQSLGMSPDVIPVGVDDRAALYRSVLAGRRMLVVLDDARDSDQVRPLLPGGSQAMVLVTSRRRLDGLMVHHGARLLPLDTLPESAAVELVDTAAGTGRSGSEPQAVRDLVRLCGGLPLALRITAARLAAEPQRSAACLVTELADEQGRLRALDVDDAETGVRRAFDLSYRNLPAGVGDMFRMLGYVPGPSLSAHAAAALCGSDVPDARDRLRALSRAHLVAEPAPDRFVLHDLLRLYARELTTAPSGSASDPPCRLLRHYLVVADRARRFLRPAKDELTFAADDAGATPRPDITGRSAALAWFDAERPNLVAAVRRANAAGLHELAWPLVRVQFNYLMVRCPWEDWIELYELGLDSARRLSTPDAMAEVLMQSGLGVAHARGGRPYDALEHYTAANRLALDAGDSAQLAMTRINLASALFRLGRYDEAGACCRHALETYHKHGDRYREAGALNNLAQVEQVSGQRESALEHLREAVVMYREADDLETLAMVLNNCGEVSTELGEYEHAERYYREALDVARQCGSAMREAAAHVGLGDVGAARGAQERARAEWEIALWIFETSGSSSAAAVRRRLHKSS